MGFSGTLNSVNITYTKRRSSSRSKEDTTWKRAMIRGSLAEREESFKNVLVT